MCQNCSNKKCCSAGTMYKGPTIECLGIDCTTSHDEAIQILELMLLRYLKETNQTFPHELHYSDLLSDLVTLKVSLNGHACL